MLKRMFDLIISLGLLVISSPILIVSYLLISKTGETSFVQTN